MHEEVNQRVVSLGIRSGRLTANVLAKAMQMYLNARKTKSHKFYKGKQSLEHLMEQNAGATNIEVDDNNIKAFDRIARKYHIDYAVKKDKTQNPPKYFVFFKCRDKDAMEMAFHEFIDHNNKKKEHTPFKRVLQKYKDKSVNHDKNRDKNREREKVINRNRGMSL